MNNEELNIILSGGENSRTEFKEALYSLPSEVFQTVVSFLNHEGGTILFGVTNLGEIKGIDPLSVDKIDNTDLFLYTQESGWIEKGVKLKNARINKINKLQFEDFQKGSSWAEKGVKVLPKPAVKLGDKLGDRQDNPQDTPQSVSSQRRGLTFDVPHLTCGLAPEERNICRIEFPPQPATLISGRTQKVGGEEEMRKKSQREKLALRSWRALRETKLIYN